MAGDQASKRSDMTRTALLALLGQKGPMSRAAIAKELDLSLSAVCLVANRLMEQGLVQTLDYAQSTGGRPGRRLGLVGTAGRAVGAKIAADHVAMVDMQLDGHVVFRRVAPYNSTGADALARLGLILQSFIEEAEVDAVGIGIGVPGVVADPDEGTVHAPALGWAAAPLGRYLRGSLGLPVLVENGVKALAYAERLYGLGRTHRRFGIVAIGRGVGFAAVCDGVVERGAGGRAGEIGHVVVDEQGLPCTCGNRGCLEAIAGEGGLLAAARSAKLIGPPDDLERLAQLADEGNQLAIDIYARAAKAFGRLVAGPVAAFDPEILLVEGHGSVAWRHWATPFAEALRSHLPPWWPEVPVKVDRWNEETSWAQGAAAIVLATPFDHNANTRRRRPALIAKLYANNHSRPTRTEFITP